MATGTFILSKQVHTPEAAWRHSQDFFSSTEVTQLTI
jgi:hypothetical protein